MHKLTFNVNAKISHQKWLLPFLLAQLCYTNRFVVCVVHVVHVLVVVKNLIRAPYNIYNEDSSGILWQAVSSLVGYQMPPCCDGLVWSSWWIDPLSVMVWVVILMNWPLGVTVWVVIIIYWPLGVMFWWSSWWTDPHPTNTIKLSTLFK